MSAESPLPPPSAPLPDFRRLFDAAQGEILVLTSDLSVVAASDGYVRATGAPREAILGRSVLDRVPASPDDPAAGAWTAGLRESLERVKATRAPDTRVVRRRDAREAGIGGEDVEARYFKMENSPVLGAGGELAYIVHHVEDVTELVRLRETSERLAEECRTGLEAHRRKDEFLATLGHELRNPLAPILTALELMRLRGGDTFERERSIIERQVHHVVRLIEDLLDVARIAQGKIQLKREPIELWQAVARAVELASPILEERGHSLHVSVPHAGFAVEADLVRLAQVVTNLLVNAAKYTEPHGHIHVLAQRKGNAIRLRVRDTGVGIAPEALPRLFELFAQAERSLHRARGGLGIGLSVVRCLTELHGGKVSAHSDGPGQGSEFVITLPAAARAPIAQEGAGRPLPPPRGRSAAPLAPADERRVLIVDDNRDAALTLADALRELGYAARVAHDGPSALAEEARFRPEVALLDIGLPEMDGYELARRLRELRGAAGIRLVALSGYGQEHDRRRSRATGFDEHLIKPLELTELRDALERLTRAPRRSRRRILTSGLPPRAGGA